MVKSGSVTRLAQRLASLRANPASIRRHIIQRGYAPAPVPDGDTVRVAAIQMRARYHASITEYVEQVCALADRACDCGAQVVVFPEESAGLMLLGLVPGLPRCRSAIEAARRLALIAPAAAVVCEAAFSTLAAAMRAYVLCGSTLKLDDLARMHKEAHLFGSDGMPLFQQAKLQLTPIERQAGLLPGRYVHTVRTEGGALAAAIGDDQLVPEPTRIAWLKGAEIVLAPSAQACCANPWSERRGLWARMQESPSYGVRACMVGELAGHRWAGTSAIYAPLELSAQGDGVLAEATGPNEEQVICTTLRLDALREYRRTHAPDMNPALYSRYIPSSYESATRDGQRAKDG